MLAIVVAAVATAAPAPQQLLAAYTAPGELLGAAPGAYAPYATAVASREFHGASPFYGYAAAPYVAAASAPYVAAPAAAYSAAYPYYF